jgi:hypothetical protein
MATGGFLSGMAGGLQQGIAISNQRAMMGAQIPEIQAKTNAENAQANVSALTANQMAIQQQYQAGVLQAGAAGGFSGALQYNQKTGHFKEAADMQQQQLALNQSLAKTNQMNADSSVAQINAFQTQVKALGGLGAMYFKDVQSGQDPAMAYQRYLPTLKQVWPDAPDKYSPQAENYLQIAVGQSLQQNANAGRYGQVGQLLSGYKQAMAAGDHEGAQVFAGQIMKAGLIQNPQTGEWINVNGIAPDTFQGDTDAKANAVGLGAGSTIPPIPGVLIQGQPLNNGMAQQYAAFDAKNNISPQSRLIASFKAPSGTETMVNPDGSTSFVNASYKAGSTPQDAAKIAGLQDAQSAFNKLSQVVLGTSTDAKGNTTQVVKQGTRQLLIEANPLGFDQPIPGTQGTYVASLNAAVVSGILKSISPRAAANPEQIEMAQREFLPQPGDTDQTIQAKMAMTHELLNGSLNIVKNGPNGPQVNWNQVDKLKDYATHGGDILDVTKGSGMNPEQARQNQLQQLQFSPQEIAYYQDPKTNGQGRPLSQQDAIALAQALQPKKGQQ